MAAIEYWIPSSNAYGPHQVKYFFEPPPNKTLMLCVQKKMSKLLLAAFFNEITINFHPFFFVKKGFVSSKAKKLSQQNEQTHVNKDMKKGSSGVHCFLNTS